MRTGIAFRPELSAWLATRPRDVKCLELRVDDALAEARPSRAPRVRAWPTALHATHLSLGTPAPLDPAELDRVVRAVHAVDPIWVGVHLGWRHRPEAELCYPQPIRLVRSMLGQVAEKCRRLVDACARPVLVENVTAFGGPDAGSVQQADFLNRLCHETGCGLLVDVTALALDARFGLDPHRWLWNVEPSYVAAIHVGGWAARGAGRWAGRREGSVADDAWVFARALVERTPVGTAILQRDAVRAADELQADLGRLAALDRVAAPADALRQPAYAMG